MIFLVLNPETFRLLNEWTLLVFIEKTDQKGIDRRKGYFFY